MGRLRLQKIDWLYTAGSRHPDDRVLYALLALVLVYRLGACCSGMLPAERKLLLLGGGERNENLLPESAVVFEGDFKAAHEITANIKRKTWNLHVFFLQ
jgi:hypothetical protein